MIKNTKFNFLKLARFLTPFSALLSLIALIVIVVYGFSYGIDFAGGNEVQVRFKKEVLAKDIRQTLQKKGIKNPTVQKFGTNNEFLIRVEVFENEKENNEKLKLLTSTLKTQFKKQSPTIRRVDSIGPQIGKELRRNGILALIYSLLMILIT